MKKKDMVIVSVEILIIFLFFSVFYFNNQATGATFLLPGATNFETCWKNCDKCNLSCLEDCCSNDQECLEDIQIMCQNNQVINNG